MALWVYVRVNSNCQLDRIQNHPGKSFWLYLDCVHRCGKTHLNRGQHHLLCKGPWTEWPGEGKLSTSICLSAP